MTPTKSLQIRICRGPNCSLLGGDGLLQWCRDLIAAGIPIDHEISGCTGNCLEAPVVEWNGRYLTEMSPAKLTDQLIGEDLA